MVASSDIITIVTADKDSVWRIHKPNTSDLLNLFLFILVIQLFERYIFSVLFLTQEVLSPKQSKSRNSAFKTRENPPLYTQLKRSSQALTTGLKTFVN